MSSEKNDKSSEPEQIAPAASESKREMTISPEAGSDNENCPLPTALAKPESDEPLKQLANADDSPSSSAEPGTSAVEVAPLVALIPVVAKKHRTFIEEPPLPVIEMPSRTLPYRTRRDVLAFGIGVIAAAVGAGSLLPPDTLHRLGLRRDISSRGKEWLLNRAIRVDDDVAEVLYSHNRIVPTYTRSQITPIKNNYNGVTPDPGYIAGWRLTLEGLASGLSVSLDIRTLVSHLSLHEQITRFVCVEGWSAIAWWAGLKFDDLLRAYPPQSQAKWARVESSVNLDNSGNPDPYFVSIDLATARHPQTLLATHHNGLPLTVEHGAPLRLLVPVKLGLKNVKAITRITYSVEEPRDYWASYGYSSYDGI
jgi:DMSO/TMAO reductase YedYZ molybdopterin-dependent catalytic subunit